MARIMAWLGGIAFVASLAYTLYFYAVVLGRPSADGTVELPRAVAVNIALFTVFAMHHSVFAREPVKRWIARRTPAQMERSFYVWLASALLIAVCLLWQRMPGIVFEITGSLRWAFYGVQLVGLVLTWRAAGALDPLELAGIRQVEVAKSTKGAKNVVFRTSGPFGFVRHPIYLGWILMVFAAPVMTIDRMLFAVISSLYLVLAIPWEEKSLISAFGDRYRAYQSTVRWRLIPGIW